MPDRLQRGQLAENLGKARNPRTCTGSGSERRASGLTASGLAQPVMSKFQGRPMGVGYRIVMDSAHGVHSIDLRHQTIHSSNVRF